MIHERRADIIVTATGRAMALLEAAERLLPGASEIQMHKIEARVAIANSYIALADVTARVRKDYA